MSQLILTRNPQFHQAVRTHSNFPLTLRVGRFFLMFSMTFLIGILSFVYLMKFTEIQTKGYQLRKLELERNSLISSTETQTTSIARLRSLKDITDSSIASRMVPARNPIFIRTDGSFARLPDSRTP